MGLWLANGPIKEYMMTKKPCYSLFNCACKEHSIGFLAEDAGFSAPVSGIDVPDELMVAQENANDWDDVFDGSQAKKSNFKISM